MAASAVVEVTKESHTAKERVKNDGGESSNKKPVILEVAASTTVPAQNKNKKINNRVQVSNNKRPFIFYLSLAKRCIMQYNDVELSALGMAIPTVVTIAEILKRNGLAIEKRVTISTVLGSKDYENGRQIEKAKIEIVLEKAKTTDDNEEA